MSQSVLVLGASGYIGQHLVRELSARGYSVLAAARHIDRLQKLDLPGVTCRSVDLNQPQALPALLAGIDTLYYLVHGMGEGGDFIAHERRVATHVRDALRQSSVRQVIFLSSLQAPAQEQSDHLRARQVTGEVLRESGVPVTELRAGIIVGAGSAAFEVMRDMVYNLPGDWRRHNTQQLIAQVSTTIKKLNPNVEFGVSPAGVWRNRSHDPAGSDTRGAAAYDESYADTRSWVQQGLLDYIAPQIYWPFARDAARYDVLANWWAEVVKPTHTRLYIGVALYKVGEPSKNEPDWTVDGGVPELKKQLDLNETLPQIQGTILFRENNLNQPQTRQAVNYLRSRWGQPQS